MLYLNFNIDLGHKYVSKPMLFLTKVSKLIENAFISA